MCEEHQTLILLSLIFCHPDFWQSSRNPKTLPGILPMRQDEQPFQIMSLASHDLAGDSGTW
jgi:hypothetical protein